VATSRWDFLVGRFHPLDAMLGQLAQVRPGEVLLVGVVLLQDGEPLQLGVGLGQGQHGRVARGDRLDLGVAQFLPADVLGTADRRFRPSSPGR
jgi:hypothetical protein